ncbi:hypothetical protein ARNL5_00513 [Anaerolineae bacterium]|nr:hypothetical protein ARNL5_00513 [Anaerolineae bacterium]
MAELPREIRGVMVPVTEGRVLLPNATVAEVISYTTPEPIAGAPAWLLGRLTEENRNNARVAVLKALGGNAGMPFIALLVQGFPRLTTITQELLIQTSDDEPHAPGVRVEVLVRDDRAIIPDLDSIESMVMQATAA